MTDNDNKPYDEELYNMMKVSDVKPMKRTHYQLFLVCLQNTCECIHADTLLSDHPPPPLPPPSSTQSSLLDNLSALLDKMNKYDKQ